MSTILVLQHTIMILQERIHSLQLKQEAIECDSEQSYFLTDSSQCIRGGILLGISVHTHSFIVSIIIVDCIIVITGDLKMTLQLAFRHGFQNNVSAQEFLLTDK